jgi:TATA-box binding protein (TBP) (component of TFIID and TFIIIB)
MNKLPQSFTSESFNNKVKITVISATVKFNPISDTNVLKNRFYKLEKKDILNCPNKFYNCDLLYYSYKESENICAKIFKNGTVHLSGLKSIENLESFSHELEQILGPIQDTKINMINTTFKVKSNNDLNSLKDILNHDIFYPIIYQPNIYHALKTSHKNGSKLLVFNNGSCCCIGKSMSDINKCVNDFIALLE